MQTKTFSSFVVTDEQIGSDETGTGDFFGPIVVVAALVTKKTLPLCYQLNIRDSKRISNQRILTLSAQIVQQKLFLYAAIVMSNERYNNAIARGFNLVQIKCLLHNTVLNRLYKRYPHVKCFCLDQFVNEKKYYDYLKESKNVIHPHMHIQGESYFPSVAVASVLARYLLLKEYQRLNAKYHLVFPRGSSHQVELFATTLVQKYSLAVLQTLCKQHFANYRRFWQEYQKKP